MVILYGITIALSAGLVFLIQPMFAKFVLPSFGSTPAVWNTSLVFFQTALLAGLSLRAREHAQAGGAASGGASTWRWSLVAVVVLPIAVPEDFRPGDAPVLSLLGLLAVSVGLPFFVVSSTAPLLQRWLASTAHPAAHDPYFLYRASNLGSVIGLLGYPLLMEPNVRLAGQGDAWSVGLRAAGAAAGRLRGGAVALGPGPEPAPEPRETLTTRRRLRWVGLAFVPSSLMLGGRPRS